MKPWALWLLCLVLMPLQTLLAAIAVDSSSDESSTSNSSSLSFSHTTGSGSDRYMLVGVSFRNDDGQRVTSVSYAGRSLSKIGHDSRDDARVEIWQLVAPPSGSSTVQVNFSRRTQGRGAGAVTFTGVDQSTPYENYTTNDASSGTASISISSETDDLVFAVFSSEDQRGTASTDASGMTAQWSFQENGSRRFAGAGATKSGASSVYMAWDLERSDHWVTAGLSINPSASGPVTVPDPRLDYRFDDCSFDAGVTDSANSYTGTSNGALSTDSERVINRSLDLSAEDIFDWVTVPYTAVNGLNDFSISVWVKPDGSKSQQEIFQALGASSDDDEIEIYLVNSSQVRLNVGDSGATVNAGKSLTDGSWHHLVVTRDANQMCLYVDGDFAACHYSGSAGQVSINNASSVIIGQEQDAFGGSFSSAQAYEGLMDEFKIYDSELTSGQVQEIYTQESDGKNVDGSDRDPVDCPDPVLTPIAEFRLDETSWNGTTNEVVDSVGSFSGEAFGTSPIDGKVCRAADLSGDTIADYLRLDGNLFSNQGDFSISAWVKTDKTTNQSLISGANNDSANELIFWFTSGTNFQPHLNNSQVGNIGITNIADDQWHHLVWTRSGQNNCLYVDKTLQGCATAPDTNIQLATGGLIVGQEQDIVGGDFVASQGFEGLIDEIIFFDGAISQTQVSEIFDLQDQIPAKNLDGSERVCPVVTLAPVADWRFDETVWESAGDVLDSSGNNYHGEATNTSPSEDAQLCRSADLTDAGTADFLSMNSEAMNGLTDFTIIAWAKVDPNINSDGTIISAANGTYSNEAVWYFDFDSGQGDYLAWPIIKDSNNFQTNTRFSSTTPELNDGDWHQVAWTRKASSRQSCFFFDGVSQGCVTHTDSVDGDPLSVVANGLIIGQEQDSTGGGFDTSQDWEGKLDEILIFDTVLNQSKIDEIRNNIINSTNWDGSPRTCPAETTLVAEWRFDEGSWNGSVNEVEDSVGNNDGTSAGGADTRYPGQICHAGVFSGSSEAVTGLDLSQLQTTASLSFWIKTSQTGNNTSWQAPGVTGVEVPGGTDDIFWGWLDATGKIGLSVGDDYATTKSNTSINDDDWHHVVLTRNATNGAYQIFIDGSLDKSGLGLSGDIGTSFSSLGRIEDTNGTHVYFDGQLDEVLIFEGVLSSSDVSSIYNNQLAGDNWDGSARGDCAASVDHYSVSHDSSGITCVVEEITITAHDSGHMPVDAESASLTISTTTGKGIWLGAVSGTSAFSDGVSNDGQATFTFSPGVTSAVLQLAYIDLGGNNSEAFGFNVTDGVVTEGSGSAIPADDPSITFALQGLRFVDSAGNPVNISHQIAGKASDVAPDAENLFIQAIKATDTAPESCNAAFSGSRLVSFAAECEAPASCIASQTFSLQSGSNNLAVPKNSAVSGTPGSFAGINMVFDSDAKAPFSFSYNDAGRMRLHARTEFDFADGSTFTADTASNDFVVRPFAFGFPSITALVESTTVANPGGDEVSGAGFTSAGSDFTVEVNAYLYDSDDDTDANGLPDAGAVVTDNGGTTPNFIGTAEFSIDSFTPSTGTSGTLSGTTSVALVNTDAIANVSATMEYTEVGSVSIKADHNNYLGVLGLNINSAPEKIGRFYPDYFALTETAVNATCDPFTYMEQSFDGVAFKLEAMSANNTITENYDAVLYPIDKAVPSISAENDDDGISLAGRIRGPASLGSWSSGVIDRTSSSADGVIDDLILARQDAAGFEDGPFDALQLGLLLSEDADSRKIQASQLNFDPDVAGSCGSSCVGSTLGSPTEIRYGRLELLAAHGPETEALPVTFEVQYWNGSQFIRNEDDSCTTTAYSNIILTDEAGNANAMSADDSVSVGSGSTTAEFEFVSASPATVDSGNYGLSFTAPGEGNQGYLNIRIEGVSNWLRYDWDQDGTAADSATRDTLITFGRARGNDRMIFWQERYQ